MLIVFGKLLSTTKLLLVKSTYLLFGMCLQQDIWEHSHLLCKSLASQRMFSLASRTDRKLSLVRS